MARLKRLGQPVVSEDSDLRIRAAWLYHSQGLTQKDVAERLGVSRGTVISEVVSQPDSANGATSTAPASPSQTPSE